jgi:hypothetical protein
LLWRTIAGVRVIGGNEQDKSVRQYDDAIPKKGDISITGLALLFTILEKKAPEMSDEIT